MILANPSARALLIGAAVAVVPLALTLTLTGEQADRAPEGSEKTEGTLVVVENVPVGELPVEEPESADPEEGGEAEVTPETDETPPPPPPPKTPAKPTGEPVSVRVPIFAGFENPRFQKHDALIARLVAAFNANAALWAGSTAGQAGGIAKLTAAQVKSHMIQESGGADVKSRAAWRKDPLQANVPGDWSSYKKYVGLHKPKNRNEGSLEANLKAGIMILARKGFSPSAQPAANQPRSVFGGWRRALQRYNGRTDLTAENRPYREVYAGRILQRASQPRVYTDIPIRRRSKKNRPRRR